MGAEVGMMAPAAKNTQGHQRLGEAGRILSLGSAEDAQTHCHLESDF